MNDDDMPLTPPTPQIDLPCGVVTTNDAPCELERLTERARTRAARPGYTVGVHAIRTLHWAVCRLHRRHIKHFFQVWIRTSGDDFVRPRSVFAVVHETDARMAMISLSTHLLQCGIEPLRMEVIDEETYMNSTSKGHA
jgi:hypothetical protein